MAELTREEAIYVASSTKLFVGMDLSGLDLSRSNFSRCDFRDARLEGCNISRSNLSGCIFD